MKNKKASDSQYTESSIKVIKGLEVVRNRPVMYLGPRGQQMLYRMLKEPIDNCVDEWLSGRNKYIEIHVDSKNHTYIIKDEAEGIPVGIHPTENKSTLEVVMTRLNAGAKFNDKSHKFSVGTHGIGVAASNGISTKFKVWTWRDKKCYYQEYSKGVPKADVKIVKSPALLNSLYSKKPKGTLIEFTPDFSIVSDDKHPVMLDKKHFMNWIKMLTLLNVGLSVRVHYDDKKYAFCNTIGPEEIVRSIAKTRKATLSGRMFTHSSINCTCAFSLSDYPNQDGILSFVSSSPTKDGGTHYNALTSTLFKVLSTHALKNEKYSNKDLLTGIIGVLDWRMSEPEFTNQIKEELGSNIGSEVIAKLSEPISTFFTKNKKLAREIIKRAVHITASREQYKKVLKSISEVKQQSKKMLLPNVLASAMRCPPDKRELFLVEGDSAAGCFSLDTKVKIVTGAKTFQELVRDYNSGITNVGKSFNLKTRQYEDFEIDEPRITKTITELCELVFEDGSVVECTPEHLWLLKDGSYKEAQFLTTNDDIESYTENSY